jgi:hypothetical protein
MRNTFATIAFAVATTAFMASASADTFSLGDLSAVSPVSQTRSFNALYSGSFTDYYTFSVASLSTVSGTTTETDGYVNFGWTFKVKDIEVSSLSLSKLAGDGTYSVIAADASADAFNFAALVGGDYRLAVNGVVAPTVFTYSPTGTPNDAVASYTLTATASTTTAVAAPVPEAADLALTAVGLAGVAFWSRRRRKV